MKQEKVTVKSECSDCGGTGLYDCSCLCHKGTAMVCRRCGGSGFIEITYTPFISKKKKNGVSRVFKARPYGEFYPEDHTFENGTTVEYSQFGCTLEEWEEGKEPKPWPEE